MDIIHSVPELRERLRREPDNVFVPTMGNLHEGHIALMHLAKPRAACTVVSIFVNRLQFGPRDDFDRYPRTLQSDCEKLRAAGVDVVFVPDEKAIYPEPQTFIVEPSDLQNILEGAHRPGHFRGVATVVLKLFNLVMPHSAIFGKKDYQQYLVLRDMVHQFALPIEIIPADTVPAGRNGARRRGSTGYCRKSVPNWRQAPMTISAWNCTACRYWRTTAGNPTTWRCAAAPTCGRRSTARKSSWCSPPPVWAGRG